MEPNRLSRDELEYELSVRGVANTKVVNVPVLRQELAKRIKREELGHIRDLSDVNRDPLGEIDVCKEKLAYLQNLLIDFTGNSEAAEYKKIVSKLCHINGRLARIDVTDENGQALANELENHIRVFEQKLVDKADNQDLVESINKSRDVASGTTTSQRKQVPVSRWNISFSGDSTGLSVNAFLERVEEYQISRNVSKTELCSAAVEILTGRALTWYRSVRSKIRTWEDFVRLLRNEFEPHDYELELWDEIRARTQGSDESVGTYIACMINLFARLPSAPTEARKLQILRRNLSPYYIHSLGLMKIYSVDELLVACKQLESNRLIAEKFQSPPINRRNLLEPDLAYQGRSRTTNANVHELATNESRSKVLCWNCQADNHVFRNCRLPRNKFCFGCGLANHTKTTCVRCHRSRSGN